MSDRIPENYPPQPKRSSQQFRSKSQRPRCSVCKEPFETLLLTIKLRKGERAHPLCAGLKAIGLEKLATTSGR